ncbi:uncharacterized protein IL334_004765 [Kwoniella shivajii]|uniref:Mtf2-like C-terminal domain-containing protein n=1 Tax=Kwoniella shivajii TaxID=564305 RepID=A0ABZ1D494_9TREE|nr:hypothetical protein IL334_004765 [Kwoniella shivajii]
MVANLDLRIISSTNQILRQQIRIQARNRSSSGTSLRLFTSSIVLKEENTTRTPLNNETVTENGSEASASGGKEEISRDMSLTAESSRSANSSSSSSKLSSSINDALLDQREDIPDEDREFAQIFATLKEKWPKTNQNQNSNANPVNHPPKPASIASRLTFDAYSTPSPRHRGVHARTRRLAGQTPKEAETFNEILAGIFADLDNSSHSSRSAQSSSSSSSASTSGLGVADPYGATKSGSSPFGFGFGLNRSRQGTGRGSTGRGLRRFFEKDETEDDQSIEELEMLKEEMEVIASDVELIEWAKNRVFKPLPQPSFSASSLNSISSSSLSSESGGSSLTNSATKNTSSISDESTIQPIVFPATYPKILAHLLRTLRVHYNSPHLVISLFQYAQTSSLESYLSGCLTSAYNELLLVRWESFRDLEGVELGIREMEIMGVRWDSTTSRLVSKVIEEIQKDFLQSQSQSQQSPSQSPYGSSSYALGNNLESGGGHAQGGFSNLIGITNVNGKWGEPEDVLDRLNKLEKKVQRDVKAQEKYFENVQKRKKRAREDRERRLEKELKNGENPFHDDHEEIPHERASM